jgi:hypothetical protein
MSTSPFEPMKQDFQPAPQAKSRFGCLGLGLGCGIVAVVGVVLLCGGGFVAAIFGVFGILKSSEPYTRSIAAVNNSAEVQEVLGTPIEEGWIPSGNINLNNDSGSANLSYSVSGPKGSASVTVQATRQNGKWTIDSLTVSPNSGGDAIDLTEDANENEPQ